MEAVLLIIIALFLFNLIIFVHEMGHMITAKLSGVWVKEFALGMGPKLFGFQIKDTKYTLRLLPIGGFCDMEGETDGSESDTSFTSKPVWKRMIIIVTGAILNLILGIVLMSVVLFQNDLLPTLQIASFTEDSMMQEAGVMENDILVSIDDYALYTEKDLSFALGTADPNSVDITVNRAGEIISFEDVRLNSTEQSGRTFVAMDFYIYGVEPNIGNVIEKTFADSYSIFRMVLGTLGGLITGDVGVNEVSGPVGLTQAITDAASQGLESGFGDAVINIVFIMSVISINLGVFNLLPFPALDGGRFVFLVIEAIRRKPVPAKYENYVNTAGFMILIGFMIFITIKDIGMLF